MLTFIIYNDRIKYKPKGVKYMSKYYSINEFSKILGVSAQTLRNWDNNNKLHPHHTSSNGYRYYSHEQLNQVMNIKPNLDRKIIGYRDWETDRKSTRLNSSHSAKSRMPSSA